MQTTETEYTHISDFDGDGVVYRAELRRPYSGQLEVRITADCGQVALREGNTA